MARHRKDPKIPKAMKIQRRPVGPASRELLREFTAELDTCARAFNTMSQSLRNRYATRIADLEGVKLEDGWKLDAGKMEWIRQQ
jgi:hypothetical protein